MIPEIGRNDAVLPVEIDVGDIHPCTALVLIYAEYAFIEYASEALELRPYAPDLGRELLHEADGLGAADGKENDLAYAASAPAETVDDLFHAHPERVATGDDVAYHQGAVLFDMELLVANVEAGDHSVLDDAFARDEVHVPDGNALAVAAFLQGIVQAAAEDGQDADVAVQAYIQEMIECSEGGGNHAEVGVETNHLGRSHEATCPRTAGYEILVGQAVRLEPVYACVVPQVCGKQACVLEDTMRHGYFRLVSTG